MSTFRMRLNRDGCNVLEAEPGVSACHRENRGRVTQHSWNLTGDSMNHELTLRIVIMRPPPGVEWRVQSGRDELLAPRSVSPDEIAFEVNVNVTMQGPVNFRGAVTQGPPKARFIYVNSGTRAGQVASCWDRRAKISLTGITRAQVARAIENADALLESRFAGTSRDGGPACATVPLLDDGWRLVSDTGIVVST